MSSPSRIVRPRRGVALPLALLILVVTSVLAFGALAMGTQTFRAGRNALVEQRAFAVAEYGLNREVSNWKRERNLPPPVGMAYGGIDSSSVYVAASDTARVKITRLGRMSFLVTSDGRASIGSKSLDSRRSVSSYVRLAYPSIDPQGAITTAGNLNIKGAGRVDGTNTTPETWAQTFCDSLPGGDKYGVVAAPGSTVNGQTRIEGALKVKYDPVAADSNTYIRYGTETWNSLSSNADIRFSAAEAGNIDFISPTTNPDGSCNIGDKSNWGEPLRTGTRVQPCEGYFPIIHVNGDLHINKDNRGQGILLVEGDFELNGTFQWIGLIVVKDDLKGNGTANVWGAVMARNAVLSGSKDDNTSELSGDQKVRYSRCALETVLRGSAILVRVTDRPWTQIF